MRPPRAFLHAIGAVVLATAASGQTTPAEGVWGLHAEAAAAWQSSLAGDASGVEGWEFTLTPRVTWLRRGTNIGLSANAGVTLRRFEPDIGQNGAGPFADATLDWERAPWSGTFSVGASRGSRIDDLVRRRVLSDLWQASTSLSYALGPRWSLETGASYSREDAGAVGLARTEQWSAYARAARRVAERLRVYAGYQIGQAGSDGTAASGTSDEGTVLLGIDGTLPVELLPGLTLNAQLGYQQRYGRDEGSEVLGGVAGSLAAEWRISPLTRLELNVARNLVTALDGAEGTATTAQATLLHTFTERASASLNAGWTRADLEGGSAGGGDADTFRVGAATSYRLAVGINLTLSAETSRTEEADGSSFDRHSVRAGVSWSY